MLLGHLEPLDQPGLLEHLERKVKKVLPVQQVHLGQQELEHPVLLAALDPQVNQDPLDHKEMQDSKVLKALLDHKEHLETVALKDLQDH